MHEQAPAEGVIPGYRLEGELGRGGMGVVYAARDSHDRQVAVKMIHPKYAGDREYQDRFCQEVAAARRVVHSNVVRVIDATQAGSQACLVMDYIDGRTLKQIIDQHGALQIIEAVNIVSQIAGALDAVHREGLTHGDVTWYNILLDANRKALLTDFGLARPVTTNPLSKAGSWITSGTAYGTQGFMAPEQLVGDRTTPATDVYALGLVFLAACLGTLPHAGTSLSDGDRLGLSSTVNEVIARSMCTNPNDRYQSAGDFATALQQAVVSGETVSSLESESGWWRSRRPTRVVLSLLAATVLVVLLVAAGLVIADYAQRRGDTTPTSVAIKENLNIRIDPSAYDVVNSFWSPYGPFYEARSDLYFKYGVSNAHAYGNSTGRFVYRVDVGDFQGNRVKLDARLSADAVGYSDSDNKYSDVIVIINGVSQPVRRVTPDDGHGARYVWQFDAKLLKRGTNQIEFVVDPAAQFPNGLCIYGGAIASGYPDEWITLRTE